MRQEQVMWSRSQRMSHNIKDRAARQNLASAWTAYVTLRVAQNAILLFFPVNFHFCRKKSATKFLCVKTSSGKSCSYIIPLSNGPYMDCGRRPHHQNLSSKWPTPSENADFDRFRLIVSQPWKLARKIQLAISRQRAFHRAIDEPCTLPLSPPKRDSKRKFLHLSLAFISSLQVIVDISNLICGLNRANLSLRMTKRPWHGRGHVT